MSRCALPICSVILIAWWLSAWAPVSVSAQEMDGRRAGKLVIAGGAISAADKAIWAVMLEGRREGRPIGIISTASEEPAATGEPLASRLNAEWGAGCAVFVPLGVVGGDAEEAATVALIRGCGGFFFTGGQQSRTTRLLLQPDGQRTAALAAIWEVYQEGGIIGGSSAGAAVMSDPMIMGGRSADALLHGATAVGTDAEPIGVSYGPGLGFHPGVLYCQHHLERGRFGRLLAALVSDSLDYQIGVGVAEDTAWVVDHQRQTGTVVGSKGVLVADSSRAVRQADGSISGVKLHYLDRGDSMHLHTGKITPEIEKGLVKAGSKAAVAAEASDAWSKEAVWHLLGALASGGEDAVAVAQDAQFELTFRRTAETQVWRRAHEEADARPSWSLSNVALEVTRRGTHASDQPMPVGKSRFVLSLRDKTLNVFTYRPSDYTKGPLLVILHGVNRNAEDYRDNAITLGDRFKALVIAPEFTLAQFPTEAYQRGGITRDGQVQAKEDWTFQYLVEVVKAVKAGEGRADLPYYLVGHSAGGQILNRLAAFLPGGVKRIVAANPGTLIFPTREMPFQFGFGNLPEALSDDAWLKNYLAAPLTLYLGTADTGLANLDVSPLAMKQGATRIERGRACFAMGKALAEAQGWPFGWRLVEAEGVGHSSADMFAHPQAEDALFGE
jgi:cyanophycinase